MADVPEHWARKLEATLEEFGPGQPELIDREKCTAIITGILQRYEAEMMADHDHEAVSKRLSADLRIELYPHLEPGGEYPARMFITPFLIDLGQRARRARNEREQIPFVAIGPEELGGPIGITHLCPGCGATHDVITEDILSAVKCEVTGSTYLIGIKGQLITTAAERKMRVVGTPTEGNAP